jgi:hypothetical protein
MTQQHWWNPGIVDMPSMTVGSGVSGGFVRVEWGSISFAPNSFADEPPVKANISLDWGLDSANTLHIFDGEIYRRQYTNKAILYDIFEPEYDTKLLDEGVAPKDLETDEDEVVAKPLIIGTVTHMEPQRTGLTTEQKYYLPDVASGTLNWYDDGVLINDNWTYSEGIASRSIDIVGTTTLSATGTMTTLADVFAWAADRMGLDFVNVHSGDVSINYVAYSQELLLDFLDHISFYCGYQYTIKNDVLYLIDMTQANGEQDISEFDFVEITYDWPMPIKKYTATWTIKTADADTVTLIDEEKKVEIFTDNPIGDEKTVTIYDETVEAVTAKMNAIAAREAAVSISLSLPLDRLPNIGEKITFTDRKQQHNISGHLFVRSYSLNYSSKTLDLQGDGEITFS